MLTVRNIHHVALTISNYEQSLRWYRELLEFERVYPGDDLKNPVFIVKGPAILALFKAATDSPSTKPEQNSSLIVRHFALCVDGPSFEAVRARLEERSMESRFADHSSQTPQRLSLYFCDPDGHEIEITTEV